MVRDIIKAISEIGSFNIFKGYKTFSMPLLIEFILVVKVNSEEIITKEIIFRIIIVILIISNLIINKLNTIKNINNILMFLIEYKNIFIGTLETYITIIKNNINNK